MQRIFIIVILSLFVTACITSEKPFYQNYEAVSPVPALTGLYAKTGSLFGLKKSGSGYNLTGYKGYSDVIFVPFEAERRHFIVQIREAKGGYQYELVKVEQNKVLKYNVATKELIKKYDLTGLNVSGSFGGYRAASRADVEDLFKAVLQEKISTTAYRIYNLSKAVDYAAFNRIVEQKQAEKARKKAAEKKKKNAKSAASSISPVEKTMRNSSVPNNQRSGLERALKGQAIKLNRTNTPFFSGLAAILVKRCSVPGNYKDRADLVKFTLSGLTGFMFGSDYSNPNLGEAIGSQMSNIALIAVGNKVGREIPCGALAENVANVIVKAIRAGTRSASGGVSNFVRSCSRTFDKRRCNCLASSGRTVIPDIYSRYYDRRIIKQIISRNPLLGLQISLTCGIVRY